MRQDLRPFIDLGRYLEDAFDISTDFNAVLSMHCPRSLRHHRSILSTQQALGLWGALHHPCEDAHRGTPAVRLRVPPRQNRVWPSIAGSDDTAEASVRGRSSAPHRQASIAVGGAREPPSSAPTGDVAETPHATHAQTLSWLDAMA